MAEHDNQQHPTDLTDADMERWSAAHEARPWRDHTVWTALPGGALVVMRQQGRKWTVGPRVARALVLGAATFQLLTVFSHPSVLSVLWAVIGFLAAVALHFLTVGAPRWGVSHRDQFRVDLQDDAVFPQAHTVLRRAHARISAEPGRFVVAGQQIPRDVSDLLVGQAQVVSIGQIAGESIHESDAEAPSMAEIVHATSALTAAELATINRWAIPQS